GPVRRRIRMAKLVGDARVHELDRALDRPWGGLVERAADCDGHGPRAKPEPLWIRAPDRAASRTIRQNRRALSSRDSDRALDAAVARLHVHRKISARDKRGFSRPAR